jgi:hypothetical protein
LIAHPQRDLSKFLTFSLYDKTARLISNPLT